MPDAAAKTKGVGFVNVRRFTFDRFGEQGWEAVRAELVPEDRRELDGVVPVGWYALALYARLIRALDRVHGAGDLALVVQLGRYEAERDLTTIHRMFLRLANPAFMLDKTAEYWRRFHDTGEWTVERLGPTHVRAYLDGWGVVDTALCRELVGYLLRTFELLGAKNVRLEHTTCRAHGSDRCTFLGRWGT
jgi:predicted hydrocarbon binding protein